jgi:mevalonate kinase
LNTTFHSHGKLLLSGEYVVLDGATALAFPTKKGQSLSVMPFEGNELLWNSFDHNNQCWFSATLSLKKLAILDTDKPSIASTLLKILREAKRINPTFLNGTAGLQVVTELDFPRDWGLGTSSTLINNIAQWAKVDAFQLLDRSFGGSGYDIAAAQAKGPLLFRRNGDQTPHHSAVSCTWSFTESLFFVHLNKKQDSKEGIARYRQTEYDPSVVSRITEISKLLPFCASLADFAKLLDEHERLLSTLLRLPTVKERLFPNYPNTIKSLGAWGGDFILALGDDTHQAYFKEKGYPTIVPFSSMVRT